MRCPMHTIAAVNANKVTRQRRLMLYCYLVELGDIDY